MGTSTTSASRRFTVSSASAVRTAPFTKVTIGSGTPAVTDDPYLLTRSEQIVTERDLMTRVLARSLDPAQARVRDFMTPNPLCVPPETPVSEAVLIMLERGFRHLPVQEAGKILGVISIGDVVKSIIQALEANVEDLMGYIMTDGPGG